MGGNWQMRTPYTGPALPATACGACGHVHEGFGGMCMSRASGDSCCCPQWVDATLDATDGAIRPAGREMDALVAEKVMGLEYHDEDGTWRAAGHLCYLDVELPNYSTDINAAWCVVENMASSGWIVDVQNRAVTMWACHVHFPAPDYRHVFEMADFAPLAICRAALVAVEGLS